MRTNFATLLTIVIIIQLYRLYLLLNFQYDLYVDEAYYWGWSKDLAFGYYSKPPMIAWTIAIFTQICGDTLFCIKLPSILIYPITTLFIYLIAKKLFDTKVAFWSGVAFITLPAVSMSSFIISTDVLLLLFWAIALYFFLQAIETDKWSHWLAAAVAAGLGLLTKYTMIIFIISVFFYLAISQYRQHLQNPKLYITAFIAALIYIPNLVWNYYNHFITFVHTQHISKIHSKSHFHFDKLLEFWAAQMAVFGPIFFLIFFYLLVRPIKDERFKVLYTFALPFFAIISLQAFLSRALANWAAPTYVAATILVVGYLLVKNYKKLLYIAISINILLALLFYNYERLLHILHIPLTSKNDPFKRVRGFSKLATKLQHYYEHYKDATLLFDDRTTAAEMIFYLNPHPFDARYFNSSCTIGNQYALKHDLQEAHAKKFLFITKSKRDLTPYFEKVEPLGTIAIELYPDKKRRYYLYLLENFKGYRCEK